MMLTRVSAKGSTERMIMPGNVRAVHVISLVDEIAELGSGIHLTKIAEKTGADTELLISVVSAAEMLGVIRSESGSLFFTDEGLKLKDVEMARVIGLMRTRSRP
jgi:hypothetical protein